MGDSVRMLGYTDDVDAAYRSVDFTLNTSFYEGFPLAIIESIGNGTPVLSYPVMFGPSTILDDLSGRIAPERTPESLARIMEMEIDKPKDSRQVFERSRVFSVSKFYSSWEKILRGK